MKCYYQRGFLRKLVNQEGAVKDFQHPCTIKHAVFNIGCAWNSVKANTLHQAWRKLWPATRVAEGASEDDDFAGFNVCNKDTLHEMVFMSENWTLQTLNVKSSRCGRAD
jgi:hypothetical protein